MTSGGKRKGAGRKSSKEGNRVPLSCRVLLSTMNYIVEHSDGSLGKAVDEIVRENKEINNNDR